MKLDGTGLVECGCASGQHDKRCRHRMLHPPRRERAQRTQTIMHPRALDTCTAILPAKQPLSTATQLALGERLMVQKLRALQQPRPICIPPERSTSRVAHVALLYAVGNCHTKCLLAVMESNKHVRIGSGTASCIALILPLLNISNLNAEKFTSHKNFPGFSWK